MSNLGKFIKVYEIGGSRFLMRGLSVAEYADLSFQGFKSLSDSLFMNCAIVAMVGWENVYDEFSGEELIYGVDAGVEDLPDSVLIELGKSVYYDLTILTEGAANKFKGHIRFMYWASDPKNRNAYESYDCNTCLSRGLAVSRPCGRFSMEERMLHIGKENKRPSEPAQASSVDIRSKYGNQALAAKREAKINKAKKGDTSNIAVRKITLNKFDYPECPISWIDEWIAISAEAMYQANQSDLPLFSGGIMDQPYKMYRASSVVGSEIASIENEKMEEERKKNK